MSDLALLVILNAFSQDYITFPNGSFIKAKIVEIGAAEIKYKLYKSANDQLYSVGRNQVYNVRYENGMIDFLNGNTVWPNQSTNLTNVETFKSPQVAATTATTTAKKLSTPVAKTATPPATTAATAVPVDISKQLNLTPEQLQILKNMLDANAAAAAQQAPNQAVAAQNPATAPVAVQPVTPTQVQPYNQSMVTSIAGASPTNQSTANMVSSLLTKKPASSAVSTTGKTKRPTAFRNYGGLLNLNTVSEVYDQSEFVGFNFLVEKKIGKSDFGLGIDGSTISDYYILKKLDLPTDVLSKYNDFGVRFSYHLPIATFIDPYVSLRGLYYTEKYTNETYSDFDTDIILGGRLMYKNVGIVYEYCLNYEYSMLGISISLN